MKQFNSLQEAHNLIKGIISYGRVWSDKRKTDTPNRLLGHRVKYQIYGREITKQTKRIVNAALKEYGYSLKYVKGNDYTYGTYYQLVKLGV